MDISAVVFINYIISLRLEKWPIREKNRRVQYTKFYFMSISSSFIKYLKQNNMRRLINTFKFMKVDGKDRRLMKEWGTNQKTTLKIADVIGKWFDIRSGQECLLSN